MLFPFTKKKKKTTTYFLTKLGINAVIFQYFQYSCPLNRTNIGQCHTISNEKVSDTYTAPHKYYYSPLQILSYIFLLSGKKIARKIMNNTDNTWLDEGVIKRNTVEQREKYFKQSIQSPHEVWTSYKCKEKCFSEFKKISFRFFN